MHQRLAKMNIPNFLKVFRSIEFYTVGAKCIASILARINLQIFKLCVEAKGWRVTSGCYQGFPGMPNISCMKGMFTVARKTMKIKVPSVQITNRGL